MTYDMERYARQIAFAPIGAAGQAKLQTARVAIIGLGALGSVIADHLGRAGVGFLRLIDRDYVELTNLQRQILYTEEDARRQLPKAAAAAAHLAAINSGITLEPVITDVNAANIENLLGDVDLVLDGSDNFEIRFLLNEACHKLQKPWIYGGALAATGASLTIRPGGPCLRCLSPNVPASGSYQTCSTAGVLNMATAIIASYEAAEALKILIDSPAVCGQYFVLDLWGNSMDFIDIVPDPDCPTCARGEYTFLGHMRGAYSTTLCGENAVQIVPARPADLNLEEFARNLSALGEVRQNRFLLSFTDAKASFKLFPDGRAIIEGAVDENAAKSIYAEYIGL